MSSKRTLIYLHALELAQASWVICEDEHVESSMLRGHLSELPLAAKQNEITVIVPAHDVLLTEAHLPKLSRSRLLQALPFSLEENLIDDVNDLHFAIADYQPDGSIPVAIVARKKMDEWFALFNQYGILPSQLYSAVFLLSYFENNWSASILQEDVTVRQNEYQGFNSDQANFPLLLELAIKNAKKKPECIHVYSTLTAPVEMKSDAVILNEIHLSEQAWLEMLPAWLKPEHSINLLQGHYQPKRKTSGSKKIWLFAGYATLSFLALAFFSQLISFFILHIQASHLETAINTLYKKNFPQSSAIVAPRERMQTKLATLEESANRNYFLVLLAKTGQQLAQNPKVQIRSLEFRDDQLNMAVFADDFADLDALTHALAQQGLTVKQQNAAIIGEQVKANLLIRRGTI